MSYSEPKLLLCLSWLLFFLKPVFMASTIGFVDMFRSVRSQLMQSDVRSVIVLRNPTSTVSMWSRCTDLECF